MAAGLECYLLRLPPGIGVQEYVTKSANPSDVLGTIVRRAEWLGKGQPTQATVSFPTPSPDALRLPAENEADREPAATEAAPLARLDADEAPPLELENIQAPCLTVAASSNQ